MKIRSTFSLIRAKTIGLYLLAFICCIHRAYPLTTRPLSTIKLSTGRFQKLSSATPSIKTERFIKNTDTIPAGSAAGSDTTQGSGTGISSKFSLPVYTSPAELTRQKLRSDSIHRFKADSLQNAARLQEALIQRHLQDSLHLAEQSQRKVDSISQIQAMKRHQDSLSNSNAAGQYYAPGQNGRAPGQGAQNGQYYEENRSKGEEGPKRMIQKEYYAGKNYAIGAQLGVNFAKAINASGSVISSPSAGILAGVFYQHGLQLFGGRTELNYSRQGFHYDDGGTKGKITNDYLSLLTMTTLSILHRAQVQFGTEEGYLLKSKDSNGSGTTGNDPISVFNRFDFGLAAGVEAYPFKGALIGFRYNLGLTNLTKRPDNGIENFIPFYQGLTSYNLKNGVFTIHFGYQLPL